MSELHCSILIPAYNAEEHIAECLQSIVGHQTKYTYEVLVIDDGSSDKTAEIVVKEFPTVRLLQKENGGPGSARNFGARNASSAILVFIDADDVMMKGRLDFQVGYMLENPAVKLTFGNQQYEREPDCDFNRDIGWADSDEFKIIDNAFARLMVIGSSIANTATAVSTEAYLEIEGQPEDVFVGEDYSMCCAVAKRWPIAASCQYLTWYRQEDHGNLMASAHTYYGPPKVLHENLKESAHLLSKEERSISEARLISLVNMLARHHWVSAGRKKVSETLEYYHDFLPSRFIIRWKLLSLIPSQVPRLVRVIKHRGRLTHAYR